jgi:hypothetical protein
MRVNPQLRVTVLGAGADHLRALQHPCLQFIETLKGRALYFPEVCAPPMGASADDTLHVFIEQNLKFAFPHLDAESLSELEKIVRMHLLEFHNHGAARRNPEVVCGVEFDDAFAPEALREVRAHYPAFVQFVANLKSTDVILPKRVRAMTPEEVAFGKGVTDWGHEDGAGHGIYFPDENLIALNSTMTPAEILKYFVHENLHAAYPTLHEVDIRNLTDYVVWELTR